MGKIVEYFCDHCKKKLPSNDIDRFDLHSQSLSLWNRYRKNFKEELYFCERCLFELKDKLEAFVHRRFSTRK